MQALFSLLGRIHSSLLGMPLIQDLLGKNCQSGTACVCVCVCVYVCACVRACVCWRSSKETQTRPCQASECVAAVERCLPQSTVPLSRCPAVLQSHSSPFGTAYINVQSCPLHMDDKPQQNAALLQNINEWQHFCVLELFLGGRETREEMQLLNQ